MATTTAVGLVALGLQSSIAFADTAPVTGTPATVSADQLPTWQINGVVWAQAVVGNTVYVAGNFTKARPPGVSPGGAGEIAANDVFAYDITTGNRVASFSHQLNGQALSIAASPDGSRIYIGGDFTTVDGLGRSHIAAFDTATNALSTTFKPVVSSSVGALAATNGMVYAAGDFNSAGGYARAHAAAFNAADGALQTWAPAVSGGSVTAMTLTPDASRVIVGGHFTTINGVAAYGMGSIAVTNGATMPWAANQRIRDAGENGGITSLTADATQVYGTGYAFGSGATFEGSFAADPTTGSIKWLNDCLGDSYGSFPAGQVLYVVSHAHNCNSIGAFPESDPRVNHRALAYTTYPTGTNSGPNAYGWNYKGVPDSTMLQWFPDVALGSFTGQSQGAWTVSGNSDYVVLGGEFPQVNGVNQQGLVRFAVASLAPNLKGPRSSSAINPSASAIGGGSAKLTWHATWDQDNNNLTYNIYRDGSVLPVGSVTQASTFWQLPSMTFTDVGLSKASTHTYQIKVFDAFGNKQSSAMSNKVTISGGSSDKSPVSVIATPACTFLACSLDGSGSTDPDGTVASYAWDFGDGTTPSLVAKPAHVYAASGTYTVKLSVTDNQGAVTTSAVALTVKANVPPTAAVAAPKCTYLACSFDGSASHDSDGTVVSYAWDFGDGTGGTGAKPVHTYPQAGTYQVRLTVKDNAGATAFATSSATAAVSPVNVAFTASPAGWHVVGAPILATVTTTPAAVGTMTLTDAGVAIAKVAVIGGQAKFSTTKLAVGSHILQAVFTPTNPKAYAAASSPRVGTHVIKAATRVTMKVNTTSVRYGVAAKSTINVAMVGSTLKGGGIANIMDGTKKILSVRIVAGTVSLTLPKLGSGSHKLSVRYLGDANALPSTSAPRYLTVGRR